MKAAHYARSIESAWFDLVEAPAVISAREYALIAEWHARGIPLQLILETLEEAVETRRRRGRPAPRSLTYFAKGVEEAWAALHEGRTEYEERAPERGARSAPVDRWRATRDSAATPAVLRGLLTSLLERLEAGEPACEIDAELGRRITDLLDDEHCRAVALAVDRRLEPFRSRMAEKVWNETRQRAIVEGLRREHDLPRLLEASRDGNG